MITKWPDEGDKGMVTLGSTRPRAVWGGCSERLQSSSWQPRWDASCYVHVYAVSHLRGVVRATRQRAVCGGCSRPAGSRLIPTLLLRRMVVVNLQGPSNSSGEHVKLRPESTSPQEGEEKPQGVVVIAWSRRCRCCCCRWWRGCLPSVCGG